MLANIPDTIMIKLPDTDIDGNYDEDVVINIANSQLIKRNPPTINVTFDVREFIRAQQEIAIDTIGFPDDVSLTPSTLLARVNFDVLADNESKIDPDQFKAVLNYKNLNVQDSTIAITLVAAPEEALNVEIDSLVVKIGINE
ncbi:MAG: hypothetical protein AAFN93_15345 [Bacteroidota bacterium]